MDYNLYARWKDMELCYAGKTEKSKHKTGIDFIDEDTWSGVPLE